MKRAIAVCRRGSRAAGIAGPRRSHVRFHLRRRRSRSRSPATGRWSRATTTHFTSFRWTQATGIGVARTPAARRRGWASPAFPRTARGSVTASASLDSTYRTQGRWTLGSGWQELMPPTPPDGGNGGRKLRERLWTSRATATRSSASTGGRGGAIAPTPRSGRRPPASSTWAERSPASRAAPTVSTTTAPSSPAGSRRRPARGAPPRGSNGSLVLLTDYGDDGRFPRRQRRGQGDLHRAATSSSASATDPDSHQRAAAMWKRTDGVFGPTQLLGWVDGSEPASGTVERRINIAVRRQLPTAGSSSATARSTGPRSTRPASCGRPSTGVVDANQYLADNGVLVDPNFTIQNLTAMTPDGIKIFGYGQMLTPPYTRRAFRITSARRWSRRRPRRSRTSNCPRPARIRLRPPSRLELALPTAASADLSVVRRGRTARRHACCTPTCRRAGGRSPGMAAKRSGRARSRRASTSRASSPPQGSALRRIVRMD